MPEDKSNFASPDHALAAGMVMGLGMRYGLMLKPVMDDTGDYTGRFEVIDDGFPGNMHVFIAVEPPVIDPPASPINFGLQFERMEND